MKNGPHLPVIMKITVVYLFLRHAAYSACQTLITLYYTTILRLYFHINLTVAKLKSVLHYSNNSTQE